MGWKKVKDYYRIKHIVEVSDYGLQIGSGYVPEILKVFCDGRVEWGALGLSKNDDLARYYAEMSADQTMVRALLEDHDVFESDIVVYTYHDGDIIEKHCEKTGWPNITQDGELMYENTFSTSRDEVVQWAKSALSGRLEGVEERILELSEKLSAAHAHRQDILGFIKKLS